MARKITPYEIRRADAQADLGKTIQDIKKRHNIIMSFCNQLDGGNTINPDMWVVSFTKTAEDREIEKEKEIQVKKKEEEAGLRDKELI